MKTTIEYFNMAKGKLQEVKPESGYTKEECLLLDESIRTSFFSDPGNIAESERYMIKNGYYVKEKLLMTDGRIAVLFN